MYAYGVGVVFFLVFWGMLFLFAEKSRRIMISTSLGMAHAGPILQYWYLKDYWMPERVWQLEIGGLELSAEDYLFAFAFSGICAGVFDFFQRRFGEYPAQPTVPATFWRFQCVIGLMSLVVAGLTVIGGTDSVSATLLFCGLGSVAIFFSRPNLIAVGVISAALVSALFWAFYEAFYLPLYPTIFEDWWEVSSLSGIYLVNVPIEEILWAGAVALFVGPFASALGGVGNQMQKSRLRLIWAKHYSDVEDAKGASS